LRILQEPQEAALNGRSSPRLLLKASPCFIAAFDFQDIAPPLCVIGILIALGIFTLFVAAVVFVLG